MTLFPFFLITKLAYKTMLDVLSSLKTVLAEGDILTYHTLVYSIILLYLFKLATVTIVVITKSYFFAIDALFEFILFLFDL